MEFKKKKVYYYVYDLSSDRYYSGSGFESVANPSYYFRRFKSIKGAEREIKTSPVLNPLIKDLTIETIKQVQKRRKQNLIEYYKYLLLRMKRYFNKKEMASIIGVLK